MNTVNQFRLNLLQGKSVEAPVKGENQRWLEEALDLSRKMPWSLGVSTIGFATDQCKFKLVMRPDFLAA